MKTAIYLRVSTGEQSTDSQKISLKNYCESRKWVNLAFYEDALSGADPSRPGLASLMSDIRAGKVERLLVFKLDRLGRSLAQLALILEELTNRKVPFLVPEQGIDTSNDNPAGRLQLNVLMAIAEFERGIIRERVNAGLQAAKARGVRLGRPGISQAVMEQVLACRSAGQSLRQIASQVGVGLATVQRICKQ